MSKEESPTHIDIETNIHSERHFDTPMCQTGQPYSQIDRPRRSRVITCNWMLTTGKVLSAETGRFSVIIFMRPQNRMISGNRPYRIDPSGRILASLLAGSHLVTGPSGWVRNIAFYTTYRLTPPVSKANWRVRPLYVNKCYQYSLRRINGRQHNFVRE